MNKPIFLKWTLKSRKKRFALIFLGFFSLLARIYMYYAAAGLPCDDGFLCGFWRYLDRIAWGEVIVLDLASWLPLSLVLLSFWGLYKKNVLFIHSRSP